MDRQRWSDLLSPSADRDDALEFFDAMVPQGITRVVVKERDRAPLLGTLPGDGYRLVAEVFIETGPRGRIATWHLDIRRPRDDDDGRQPWRIVVAETGCRRSRGCTAWRCTPTSSSPRATWCCRSVDFEVRLPAGEVFVAETPEGVTALVLLGDGTMVFSPAPRKRRARSAALRRHRDARRRRSPRAFVRLNPFDFEQRGRRLDARPPPAPSIRARSGARRRCSTTRSASRSAST